MAKKRSRTRRKFNLRRVRLTPTLPLGALATVTAITIATTGNADGAYRCVSIKGTWIMKELTTDEGPVIVGFAHSDYTVAEIKEAIEASASISVGNKVEQERANRLVRQVGIFMENGALNDGEPISTKLNWLIPIGKEVNVFAYNDDTVILATGSRVNFNGNMWVKDST